MNITSEMEHILICLKEHIALSNDEDNLLLDYIINLQQENEMLKDNAIHNDKVIDKAIEFINNNGAKQYNHHDNYRGKWYSPDELDTILDILKEVE